MVEPSAPSAPVAGLASFRFPDRPRRRRRRLGRAAPGPRRSRARHQGPEGGLGPLPLPFRQLLGQFGLAAVLGPRPQPGALGSDHGRTGRGSHRGGKRAQEALCRPRPPGQPLGPARPARSGTLALVRAVPTTPGSTPGAGLHWLRARRHGAPPRAPAGADNQATDGYDPSSARPDPQTLSTTERPGNPFARLCETLLPAGSIGGSRFSRRRFWLACLAAATRLPSRREM